MVVNKKGKTFFFHAIVFLLIYHNLNHTLGIWQGGL